MKEPQTMLMAETANYVAWCSEEPDGEMTYHLDVGNVTLHFFQEEWDEFLELIRKVLGLPPQNSPKGREGNGA